MENWKTSTQYNLRATSARRRSLRNNSTPQECVLWLMLKARKIEGLKFRRQFGVGHYILDFYCPEIRLCVELDGDVHNDMANADHDFVRTRYLNSQGIYVLRFENHLVYDEPDMVQAAIRNTSLKLRNNELNVGCRIVSRYQDISTEYRQ